MDLPPYIPELNPCKQLWDSVKGDTVKKIFTTVPTLRTQIRDTLRLIGRDWLLSELYATLKSLLSI